MYNIALFQPDIPQNTAATIRLCACLNVTLEIIEPCGFQFNEKKLKSIYMDYYEKCKIIRHLSFEDFIETKNNKRIILLTTKAKKIYYNFQFKRDDTILFGRESAGVPDSVHKIVNERLKIPISKDTRSLNVVTSVSI
ncbi:MAG: tRNA (cytidine(34)-2'-O)-methyltransferase, partial [Candidatus Fonsibacter sp.]